MTIPHQECSVFSSSANNKTFNALYSSNTRARKWGMRFQPVKCNMMQLTNKHLNKIQASYTLEGTVLENVDNIKYLGVTITNDSKWNTHISNIYTKANRTLGFLRRTLFFCPQNVKEAAYKGMVRPILEYGSSVWDPHPDKLQKELEKVQNRAARFVTRNYDYETGSMTGILGQLKWEGERIIDSYCYRWSISIGVPLYLMGVQRGTEVKWKCRLAG